jgi:hypothetical protein
MSKSNTGEEHCNGIHQGWVPQVWNNVEVVVRGKKRKAQVTKMPFVPSKYWKGAALLSLDLINEKL